MPDPKKIFVSRKWAKKLPKGGISPGGTALTDNGSGRNVYSALDDAVFAAGEGLPDSEFVILDDIFAGKRTFAWDNTLYGSDVKHFSSSDETVKDVTKFTRGGYTCTAQSKLVPARILKWSLGTVEDDGDAASGNNIVTADGFKNIVLQGTAAAPGREAETADLQGGGLTTVSHTYTCNNKNDAANREIDQYAISASAGGTMILQDRARVAQACGWAKEYSSEYHDDDILFGDGRFCADLDFGDPASTAFTGNRVYLLGNLPGYKEVSVSGGSGAAKLFGGSVSMTRSCGAIYHKDFPDDTDPRACWKDRKITKTGAVNMKGSGKLIITGEDSSVDLGHGYAEITIGAKAKAGDLYVEPMNFSAKSAYTRNAAWKTENFDFRFCQSQKSAGKLTLQNAALNSAVNYASVHLSAGAGAGQINNWYTATLKFSLAQEYTNVTAPGSKILNSEKYQNSVKTALSGSFTAGDAAVDKINGYKSVTIGSKISGATVNDMIRAGGVKSFTTSMIIARDQKTGWYKQAVTGSMTQKSGMNVHVSNGSAVTHSIEGALTASVMDSSVGNISGLLNETYKGKEIYLLDSGAFTLHPAMEREDNTYNVYVEQKYHQADTASPALKSVTVSSSFVSSSAMNVTLIDSEAGAVVNAKKVTAETSKEWFEEGNLTLIAGITSDGKTVETEKYTYGLDAKGRKTEDGALYGHWTTTTAADGTVSLSDLDVDGEISGYATVSLFDTWVNGSITAGSYTQTADYMAHGLESFNYAGDADDTAKAKTATGYMEKLQNDTPELSTSFGTLKLTGAEGADPNEKGIVAGSILNFKKVTLSTFDLKTGAGKYRIPTVIDGSIDSSDNSPADKIKTFLTVTGTGTDFEHVCKGDVKGFSTILVKGDLSVGGNVTGTAANDKLTVSKGFWIETGTISFDAGNDSMSVAGTAEIYGDLLFGDGKNTLSSAEYLYVKNNLSFGGGNDAMTVSGNTEIGGDLSFGDGKNTLKVNGLMSIGGALSGVSKFTGSGEIMMTGANYDNAVADLHLKEAGSLHCANTPGKTGKKPGLVRFADINSMEGFQGVQWELADNKKARTAKVTFNNADNTGWLGADDGSNFSDTIDLIRFQCKDASEVVFRAQTTRDGDVLNWSLDGGEVQSLICSSAEESASFSCDCSDGKKHTLNLTLGESNQGTIAYRFCKR